MIQVGVLGATGYAGAELVRLLSAHKDVTITMLASKTYAGQKMSEIYPALRGVCDIVLEEADADTAAAKCDVVFTALPHGVSNEVISALYEKGLKIIAPLAKSLSAVAFAEEARLSASLDDMYC